MLESYSFIINPNSGAKRDAAALAETIKNRFCACARVQISFTERQGHARELAREAVRQNFKAVVVAGGDGTLNEVLPALCETQVALGLIAKGSGNGFARELGLPLAPGDAVSALADYEPRRIDAGKINGEYFVNVAGIGIDAMIGRAFNAFGKKGPRGRLPYFYLGVKEFLTYTPPCIDLRCGGQTLQIKPLCLAFANGRQFGGGAVIAPAARPDDGLLHIVTINYLPLYRMVPYLPKLFTGTIDRVPFVSTITADSAEIISQGELTYQLDGELRCAHGGLKVEVAPGALSFLSPAKK